VKTAAIAGNSLAWDANEGQHCLFDPNDSRVGTIMARPNPTGCCEFGVETIRFSIGEACGSECWADVTILSRPPEAETVTAEGDDGTECGSGTTKTLGLDEVRVYDVAGCFLNEDDADLAGRIGFAAYLTRDAAASDPCEVPESRWEIFSLVCPDDACNGS
jgi:hypothetical protein